jgi:hypothetical protein
MSTQICGLHMAFQILYTYNYVTKWCKQQMQVIQNHENAHIRNTGQGIRGLNLTEVRSTSIQVIKLPL